MSKSLLLSDVIDSLKKSDFDYIGKADNGWQSLTGVLRPPRSKQTYRIVIQIDPYFLEPPRIQLLDTPKGSPPVVPHLSANGILCYLGKGSVVLDIFDPVGQTLACINRAEFVLDQIINNEVIEDLAEEFYIHWRGMECFIDLKHESQGKQICFDIEIDSVPYLVVTDDRDRTLTKLTSLKAKVIDRTITTYRVKTKAQPKPLLNAWPPKRLKDILEWQQFLDSNCRKKILHRVKEAISAGNSAVLIIIESPLLTYGFAVYIDSDEKLSKMITDSRKRTMMDMVVVPISMERIDDRYLAQRNIPNLNTLAGKKIALIGCGTIGGFLAEMLVKAGAGTSDGMLKLVDYEELQPQNIGRHRLGFQYLFSNKAKSLATELVRSSPGSNVVAAQVDVRKVSLEEVDLLIDATGEEALGHWLCQMYSSKLAMLSIWIEGPGIAVRGILKAHDRCGCYRCLWHTNKKGLLNSTTSPMPQVLAGHGCEGLYVPFPAYVSLIAAGLGAEMTLNWINNTPTPSVRCRLIDTEFELATSDYDLIPDPDCPVCNS